MTHHLLYGILHDVLGENSTNTAASVREPVADASLNSASDNGFKGPVKDTPLNNELNDAFNNTNNH